MKVGFVGCGNMAVAMINGMIKKGTVSRQDLMASAKTEKTRKKITEELQIQEAEDNQEVARWADVLILAVKPMYMQEVIEEIRDSINSEKVIVTLAPGKTLAWLDEMFQKPVRLVRTMPNTPALVGEGMTALCPNERITAQELQMVRDLFDSFGKTQVVSEPMIDVVVGVSGSSPAYVFLFIEAMADAAVADGMPRAQAYEFAAQAVLGSAKMVLESGMHPGVLKDMVCSPGGTTIEAVRVLEKTGMRSSVIEASKAAVKKAREL